MVLGFSGDHVPRSILQDPVQTDLVSTPVLFGPSPIRITEASKNSIEFAVKFGLDWYTSQPTRSEGQAFEPSFGNKGNNRYLASTLTSSDNQAANGICPTHVFENSLNDSRLLFGFLSSITQSSCTLIPSPSDPAMGFDRRPINADKAKTTNTTVTIRMVNEFRSDLESVRVKTTSQHDGR